MFNHLKEANLSQIKAMSDHFGEIYFHGCGNIYHDKVQSENAKIFSNEGNAPQTYRIKFSKGDKYPTTVEELVKLLHKAKAEDIAKEKTPSAGSSLVTTFVMPKEGEGAESSDAGDDGGEGGEGGEDKATKGKKGAK